MNDKEWDRRLRVATVGRDERDASEKYSPYEPTPYRVLERMAAEGLVTARDHLLDYGCGKGRVGIFFARETGCRATGIDFSERMIASAERNRLASGADGRVTFLRRSAETYEIRGENVFYFFNPFSEAVLRVALRRVVAARYESGDDLRLLLYYPSDEFTACLMTHPNIAFSRSIDCRDLFPGGGARERVDEYLVTL